MQFSLVRNRLWKFNVIHTFFDWNIVEALNSDRKNFGADFVIGFAESTLLKTHCVAITESLLNKLYSVAYSIQCVVLSNCKIIFVCFADSLHVMIWEEMPLEDDFIYWFFVTFFASVRYGNINLFA